MIAVSYYLIYHRDTDAEDLTFVLTLPVTGDLYRCTSRRITGGRNEKPYLAMKTYRTLEPWKTAIEQIQYAQLMFGHPSPISRKNHQASQ